MNEKRTQITQFERPDSAPNSLHLPMRSMAITMPPSSLIFDNTRIETAFYLVTKPMLCRLLALSPSYISKLMGEEGLPYLKIGRAMRFRPKEVVEWLQKRKMP